MNDEEISLFDIADWLWSFRLLMLVCAVVGIGGSLAMWRLDAPQTTKSYDVTYAIYSGGTPVRTAAEIADILIAATAADGVQLTSKAGTNPVTLRIADEAMADAAAEKAVGVTGNLVEEVAVRLRDLERLLPTNDNALQPYLSAKSYLAGVESGLIVPVTPVVAETVSTSRAGANALLPLVIAGVAFFGIAGATTFASAWRRHRAEKEVVAHAAE